MVRYIVMPLVRPRFAVPLGTLALFGLGWWAVSAQRLLRQIDSRTPTTMSLTAAVNSSKDGEVYVRLTDLTVDCEKVLNWNFGRAVALVTPAGQVAAMGHFESCPERVSGTLEGVFLEPPYGIYGEAWAQGWNVTPGHLAYFEPDLGRSRATTRIGIALADMLLILGWLGSGLLGERRPRERHLWRTRALGFWLMAGMAWWAYYAHEYVWLKVVPGTIFCAVGFAVGFLYVAAAGTSYMQKYGAKWLPSD